MDFADVELFLATESSPPRHRIEPAMTGRSTCQECNQHITRGDIRIGAIQTQSWGAGKYSRWCHLNCWHIPTWASLALPSAETCDDPVLFEHALLCMNDTLLGGTRDLTVEELATLVLYVMIPEHWVGYLGNHDDMTGNVMKENEGIVPLSLPSTPRVSNILQRLEQNIAPIVSGKVAKCHKK